MFKVYANAWKVKEIRNKLVFVLIVVAIYRLGAQILLPGINPAAVIGSGSVDTQSIFAMIAGGNMGTIFMLGIGPYITSSIIMQLLTVAIPPLERLQKEGEEGRKKINEYTRYVAIGLSLVQGIATVFNLRAEGWFNNYGSFTWMIYVLAVVTLATGTMFIMWLSELLTERAVGNGSSFIIFANILSGLPRAYATFAAKSVDWIGILIIILILVIFTFIIAFVVLIQNGERRLPVQYSKKMVGKQMFGGQSSFIPIKVNIAGVMSIIFAISLLGFPKQISQFASDRIAWLKTLSDALDITTFTFGWLPIGTILYVILIFVFTFFYTSFAVNPVEMAENLKKNGGFIPGIRSGKPTSEYIERTINRLSWIGAVFYSFLALVPVLIEWIFQIKVGIGGTTLLIVVGVALELVKQLESQLLMRHYKGFL